MTSVQTPQSSSNVPTPPRRGVGRAFYVVLALAVILSGTLAVVAIRQRNQANRPPTDVRLTGIPSTITTSLANLMSLSPLATHLAPDFTLIDQNGRTFSLHSFRGRAVVLEFMDPHCTDICPLVSQEFVDAYRDLGKSASHVVFVAVNVNQYFASVANMKTFSLAHRLSTIPSWHFFTGATSQLKAVWRNYGILVEAPNPNADIIHTSALFFIDPSGHERFIATPVADHNAKGTAYLPAASLSSWGHGISLVAKSLFS